MRTISLRQFRDSIAKLDEPVEVARRDGAGNLQIIGRWEPSILDVPGSTPLEPLTRGRGPAVLTTEGNAKIGTTMTQMERDSVLRRISKGS